LKESLLITKCQSKQKYERILQNFRVEIFVKYVESTEAEKELKRAVELNPNYAMAHHWYAMHLLCMGRVKEALAENDQARRLDPFSLPTNNFRAQILLSMREYDRAIEQAEKIEAVSASSANRKPTLVLRYDAQRRMGFG
jgi:tetratricopeptide (TPR) repeat protein